MERPYLTKQNQTAMTFFIIKGVSDVPGLQVLIFLLVLLMYLFTLGGNTTILLLISMNRHLHSPMYFLLANLSIVDMCFITVTLHNVLLIALTGDRVISRPSYIAQMYFIGSFLNDELLFLTAMSYDRYVAICNPLRYTAIMNHRVCALLAIFCWIFGFIEIMPYAILVTGFTCYRSIIVNHFFCDILPLIQLSCSDTFVIETLFKVEGAVVQLCGPFFLTFLSYIFIITAIVRIRSTTGRLKAFYTCSSHLTVVILLYTTLIFQYLKPIAANSGEYNKVFSLLNTAAVPMLNPIIYSLKNKGVKAAFKRRLFGIGK